MQIPGTDDVLESMLAVPMAVGDTLLGVITLSMLGYGKFDEEDQRLLEVLASHAAVAFQNAKLFQAEREAAETSTSLLHLSQTLTQLHSVDDILQAGDRHGPPPGRGVRLWPRTSATRRPATSTSCASSRRSATRSCRTTGRRWSRRTSPRRSSRSETEPFVDHARHRRRPSPRALALRTRSATSWSAPLHWEPDGFGAIVMGAKDDDAPFTEQDLRLARGIADITSLALGNARRLSELERFHELVASLDAVFWEADAASLRLSFIGGRAEQLLGAHEQEWITEGRRWGDHAIVEDRDARDRRVRASLRTPVRTRTSSTGSSAPDGRTIWIRDMVHVVRAIARAAAAPRPDDRHHRAQARRAGPATERAEVLGSVPTRARGGSTPPRARRHEEHVPGGGLARPPDPAHVDPRLRAHARADRARTCRRRTRSTW